MVTHHEQLQQQHQQKQHGLVDVALISPPPAPPLSPATLLAPSPAPAAAVPLLEYWGLSTLSTAAVGDWQAFCGRKCLSSSTLEPIQLKMQEIILGWDI